MRRLNATDMSLWRLALPMILSNITVPLLGVVDTAVIGHLDSPVYLGGVAIGTTATSFLFMLLLFLRMSTTGLTAQAFGAGDQPGLGRAFIQPMLLALLAGVVMVLLRQPLTELALQITGGSEAVQAQARQFMHLRWLGAPATLMNLVLLGWLLGVQYARAPVILLVVGNLVNIVLDIWLVMGVGMGVRGAALATISAEYVTLALGLIMVWRVCRRRGLSLAVMLSGWRGDLSRLLRLNRDILLRSLLLQLCFASLTVLGARLGSEVVAANAILLMFMTFTAYALDGFAYAVEACSGEAVGARDARRLRAVWRAACRQAGAVALAFSLLWLIAGTQIIAMLTSLPALRELAGHYLIWQVIIPLAGVWCYLLDGMFIGATRGADMRNSMAVAALGFFLTLLTLPLLGNHALWLAVTVFLLLRGMALGWIWHRHQQRGSWFSAA
ncbi:MATE family efflux transporter DinF [Pantoea sp. 1.19]|uniref:MATE family efflux transporter DinF n=1 Tax=Pantoea sp. 1.19 TaxID=1925589 RepID=UPI000948D6B4|nr:MATE family efflux transporter DinF [Pantoea sp. 1.19]